jgi:hypothetical protein
VARLAPERGVEPRARQEAGPDEELAQAQVRCRVVSGCQARR